MDGAVTKRLTLIAGYSGRALEKGVGRIRTGFNRVRSAAVGVGRAIGRALRTPLGMIGLGGGIYGLIRAFTGLMGASTKQEEIFRKLQSAVELTGLNYADVKGQIDSYLAGIQKVTRYGDTDMAPVLQMITQLTGSLEKGFEGAKIAADMTAAGLFDLGTSAKYVAMAMAGEVTMLGRYIPELKVTYGLITQNMTATEKWAIAKELLNQKLGGMAQKDLYTFAGMMQSLKNYLGDIKERFGDIISLRLTPKLAEWRDAIIDLTERGKIEEWIKGFEREMSAIVGLIKTLISGFTGLRDVIREQAEEWHKLTGDYRGYIDVDELVQESQIAAIAVTKERFIGMSLLIKAFENLTTNLGINTKETESNLRIWKQWVSEWEKPGFIGPKPLLGPEALPSPPPPPPGAGIPAIPEMELELELRTQGNQQIEEIELIHQDNMLQAKSEYGDFVLEMLERVHEQEIILQKKHQLQQSYIFAIGYQKYSGELKKAFTGEMKFRNAMASAVVQSAAAMVSAALRERAREWFALAGAYALSLNFPMAARYAAGGTALELAAGWAEHRANVATGAWTEEGGMGGAGGGYEGGGAAGGGARTQYGTTVSAERMEMHISPSVSIIGDIIVIGDIGVEELKATLGQVSVESVQDALETGEIDIQKAVK